MLLGVMTLEAEPKYRIETWIYNGTTYYLPQKRVWARTNYFYLPFKVWQSGAYPFQKQSDAEQIIENWKFDYMEKQNYRNSKYIKIN